MTLILLEAEKNMINRLMQKQVRITSVGELVRNLDAITRSMYCDVLLKRALWRLPGSYLLEKDLTPAQKQNPGFLIQELRGWLSSHRKQRDPFNEPVFDTARKGHSIFRRVHTKGASNRLSRDLKEKGNGSKLG